MMSAGHTLASVSTAPGSVKPALASVKASLLSVLSTPPCVRHTLLSVEAALHSLVYPLHKFSINTEIQN
jgi:hypothetical protein